MALLSDVAIPSFLDAVTFLPHYRTSDAIRKQKNLFLRLFPVQYWHSLKNITPWKPEI